MKLIEARSIVEAQRVIFTKLQKRRQRVPRRLLNALTESSREFGASQESPRCRRGRRPNLRERVNASGSTGKAGGKNREFPARSGEIRGNPAESWSTTPRFLIVERGSDLRTRLLDFLKGVRKGVWFGADPVPVTLWRAPDGTTIFSVSKDPQPWQNFAMLPVGASNREMQMAADQLLRQANRR